MFPLLTCILLASAAEPAAPSAPAPPALPSGFSPPAGPPDAGAAPAQSQSGLLGTDDAGIADAGIAAAWSAPPPVAPVAHDVTGASLVHFRSNDADLTHGKPTQLSGWLFRPKGRGIFPAVIALHSCGGLFAPGGDLSARHRDWAERLVKLGYVVLFPDSFSARHEEEQCTSNPDPLRSLHERTRDAYGALVYLQHQSYVRLEAISLLGWSAGGTALLAAVDKRSRARPAGLIEDFHGAVALYPDCQSVLGSKKWSPKIPLHVLIGKADDWTSASDCSDLVEHAKARKLPADIVVYPDAFHDFDVPDMPVHQRHHLAATSSGNATVGTNPAARADAIERVPRLLAGH